MTVPAEDRASVSGLSLRGDRGPDRGRPRGRDRQPERPRSGPL